MYDEDADDDDDVHMEADADVDGDVHMEADGYK